MNEKIRKKFLRNVLSVLLSLCIISVMTIPAYADGTKIIMVSDDVYTSNFIEAGRSDTSWQYNNELWVGNNHDSFSIAWQSAAMKFQEDLPERAVVSNAALVFYASNVYPGATVTINSCSNDSWNEATTTFPISAEYTPIAGLTDISVTSGENRIDVTDYVCSEFLGDGVASFVLTGKEGDTGTYEATIYSEDNATNKPYLDLSYFIGTAPAINTQPDNVTVNAGSDTSFTVAATGTNLTYQWQVNTGSGFTNITDGGVYSGATMAALNITGATSAMNGYTYRVIISGAFAPSVTSDVANLAVSSAPSILNHPSNATVNEGSNTSFTVAAAGTGLNYQWQVNTDFGFTNITNGGVYSGATTATLNITGATNGMNGYTYQVVVTGTVAPAATSNPATLTVNTAPVINTQPGNATVNSGDSTSFTVAAAGTGMTYQWQVDTGSGFTNITNGGVYSGATTATLNITGATNGMNGYTYQVVVTGAVVPAATSNTATLTVMEPTVTGVSVSPATADVAKGNTKQFSTSVDGTNSPSQTVTWNVEGNSDTNTSISITGLLSVGSGESADTITVRATSTVDTSKSGIATITVTETDSVPDPATPDPATPDPATPDPESDPTPDLEPDTEEKEIHHEKSEKEKEADRIAKAKQDWKESVSNPRNYLTTVKNDDGTSSTSGVPTKNQCEDYFNLIVKNDTQEAERFFSKTASENQIVVTFTKASYGEELKNLLEDTASAYNGKISKIIQVSVQERTKKDYKLIRDIESTEELIRYSAQLSDDLLTAVKAGKKIFVIGYNNAGEIEVLQDMDDMIGTVAFETKNPSSIFAFVVAQ